MTCKGNAFFLISWNKFDEKDTSILVVWSLSFMFAYQNLIVYVRERNPGIRKAIENLSRKKRRNKVLCFRVFYKVYLSA